ncbi:MAG: TauD/TfdA family dioxygenase [Pseudomonadota bacterium]|nr:TauD/TfdA family dioxygenase [Pseudomonadota bacterium]
MAISIKPLTPHFGAELTGVDISNHITNIQFGEIREAFDEYSVLVLPDQPLTDEQQIIFSQRFGILEGTRALNPGSGTPFARQSNLDIKTGETIPLSDRRMFYQKANMLWHSDSTFKSVPSLCSVLSAREIPPVGGATEFASTRVLYGRLSENEQNKFADLVIEHDFVYSRGIVGFTLSEDEAAKFPAAHHDLVRKNKNNGRRSLMIGAHAKTVVGWWKDQGRTFLENLVLRATAPNLIYRHEWRENDVVIWDNQAILHRATPYDTTNHRRLMQRTTISSSMPTN